LLSSVSSFLSLDDSFQMGTEDFTRAVGAFGGESLLSATGRSIDESESALIAPFMYHEASSGSVTDVIRSFGARASVFDSSATGASIVSDLRAQSLGASGKTDVVIVQLEQLDSNTDALIQTVTSFVAEQARQNFVAILTADSSSRIIDTEFGVDGRASRSLLGFESIELQQTAKLTAAEYPGRSTSPPTSGWV
jgi:hypothetical protein